MLGKGKINDIRSGHKKISNLIYSDMTIPVSNNGGPYSMYM